MFSGTGAAVPFHFRCKLFPGAVRSLASRWSSSDHKCQAAQAFPSLDRKRLAPADTKAIENEYFTIPLRSGRLLLGAVRERDNVPSYYILLDSFVKSNCVSASSQLAI